MGRTMPAMLNWLASLRRARVGDGVEVLDGPYAGRSGVVTRVEDGTWDVFIDECCQPRLQGAQLRRVRRRSLHQVMKEAREADPIAVEGRAAAEIRDWVDSMGPR